MKCLSDTANNVQAYTSTRTEYKLDVGTMLQGEVQSLYNVGKSMACRGKLYTLTEIKTSSIN